MTAHKPAYANLPPCPYCDTPVYLMVVTNMYSDFYYHTKCSNQSCGAMGPGSCKASNAVLIYYQRHPANRQYEIARRLRQAACVVKRGSEG